MEIVADDYNAIGETVTRLSSQHDLVFTSGGIGKASLSLSLSLSAHIHSHTFASGPTHDDITYEAIARAYSLPLQLDDETCCRMAEKAKPDWTLTDARKRMAIFPSPAQIIRADPSLWVPVVVVHDNIHILPGIPQLFERLVKSLRPHLDEAMAKKNIVPGQYHRMEIASKLPEGTIAARLSTIQDQVAAEHVKIGSYPKSVVGPDGERVVVSIVGKNQAAVQDTAQRVTDVIDGWTYVKKH